MIPMQTGTLEAGFPLTPHCHLVLGIDGRLVMLLLENQDIDVNIKNARPEWGRWTVDGVKRSRPVLFETCPGPPP